LLGRLLRGDEADLDSMDVVNLVAALHDETSIDVPEHDYYSRVGTRNDFIAT